MHGDDPNVCPGAADGRLREIRRHGHVGSRIVQRDARDIGKISRGVLGCECRHRRGSGRRVETRSLIIDEEEELVLLNRAAERCAELVPAHVGRSAVHRRIGAEVARPLIGVEKVVAQKFERVAMKLVAAGLGLTLITPPRKWPNSALGLFAMTLNSWIASTLGEYATLLSTNSLLSMPSSR